MKNSICAKGLSLGSSLFALLLAGCSAQSGETMPDKSMNVDFIGEGEVFFEEDMISLELAGNEEVNAGWQKMPEIAPGVWELRGEDGEVKRIVGGEEGHAWLAQHASEEIARLEARIAAGETEESLAGDLAAAKDDLETAKAAKEKPQDPSPGVVVMVSTYAGPSSPITNPPVAGAAALAQINVAGGCKSLSVTSKACCAAQCTPNTTFTKNVCNTTWNIGVVRKGSGIGYAKVSVASPEQSKTNNNFVCH